MLLKWLSCAYGQNWVILKSGNPKRSYAHLTFGVSKSISGDIGFQSFGFIIGLIANLARNAWKLHHLDSGIFTVHLKHIKDYDFAKIFKKKK